jgi:hypothetical protein
MKQIEARRIPSSGVLRRVPLVRTDETSVRGASIIRVTRIDELGTTLALNSNRRTLRRNTLSTANVVPSLPIRVTMIMEALHSSETSVPTRATRHNIPEYGILLSYRLESLKSYIALTGWALYRRRIVFPVRYELGFYIQEDDILHSHRREKPQILNR